MYIRVLLEQCLGNNLECIIIAVTTPCQALLLAAADACTRLGNAAIKALFPHCFHKLLKACQRNLLFHLLFGWGDDGDPV